MAVTVGLLQLRLHVAQANSLKDKRRAVKSFKDRVRGAHNVSVAEVDCQDHHRWAVLAVAAVGSDRRYLEGVLTRIAQAAAQHRDMLLIEQQTMWL